jgi:hypothetical protein
LTKNVSFAAILSVYTVYCIFIANSKGDINQIIRSFFRVYVKEKS